MPLVLEPSEALILRVLLQAGRAESSGRRATHRKRRCEFIARR